MTDGSSAAQVPGERRRQQVSQRMALAMMIAGVGGTGYFQHEASISRDEATRITAARNRYEDLLQHCQERESDRMESRLNRLEGSR